MSGYPLADIALARRIESAIAQDVVAYLESTVRNGVYPDARWLHVADGVAVWFCDGNVVNGAFGLGMSAPVDAADLARLIDFFEERRMAPRVDVCPLADPSLLSLLAAEHFVAVDFETVLFQPLPRAVRDPLPGGVAAVPAASAEMRALWAELEARGFTEDAPSDAERELSRAISLREDAVPFLGYVDGEAAGTGMLVVAGDTALFNGDSTLPALRGRGVQRALLAERLRVAGEAGCDLAVIEAAPGGVSERNQQRAGFRVAYTRVSLERPLQG